MHTNGFHPVSIQFCECDKLASAGNRIQQLLRYELYPATLDDPTTCATLRLLETFHLLTLQSKVTAYDFYQTLLKMTDRMGIKKSYVRRLSRLSSCLLTCSFRSDSNLSSAW